MGIQKDDNAKPIFFRAWDDICRPMHKGGLSFRNLAIMNESLITNMAWNIINNSAPLIAKVHKSKYFRNSTIWKHNIYSPKSAFWTSFIKVLPDIINFCNIKIAKGNTSI